MSENIIQYRIGMLVNLDKALSMKALAAGYDYIHPARSTIYELATASMEIQGADREAFAAWKLAQERGAMAFPTVEELRAAFDPAVASAKLEELKRTLMNPTANAAYQKQQPARITPEADGVARGASKQDEGYEDPFRG